MTTGGCDNFQTGHLIISLLYGKFVLGYWSIGHLYNYEVMRWIYPMYPLTYSRNSPLISLCATLAMLWPTIIEILLRSGLLAALGVSGYGISSVACSGSGLNEACIDFMKHLAIVAINSDNAARERRGDPLSDTDSISLSSHLAVGRTLLTSLAVGHNTQGVPCQARWYLALLRVVPGPDPPRTPPVHRCDECGRIFDTRPQLCLHKFSAHRSVIPEDERARWHISRMR